MLKDHFLGRKEATIEHHMSLDHLQIEIIIDSYHDKVNSDFLMLGISLLAILKSLPNQVDMQVDFSLYSCSIICPCVVHQFASSYQFKMTVKQLHFQK